MIYSVYAIRDVKSGFLTPTVDISDDTAKRNFAHAVMNSDSLFFTFASDYSLYQIGTYDTDTGRINPLEVPQILCEAVDFKKGE